ncbi:hypothetical protein [Porticoccus sp.]
MSARDVEYLPASEELIRYVADNMRAQDVVEVSASGGHSPFEALDYSVQGSGYSTVAVIGGEPVAVFGLALRGILGRTGVPWMLGTDGVSRRRRVFAPKSREVIEEMLSITPYLYNYAHVGNTVSIRWLKWLGFEFEDAAPYGVRGELFHRFYMEKTDV